jgi:hypothetical protein
MKRMRLISLLLAVLLAASTTPALAEGKGPKDPNPNSQIAYIEQFEYVQNGIGMGLLSLDSIVPLASGCRTYTLGVNGYSAVGIKVWSYAWNIYWCYNGSTITSLSKWRTVWANYGWSFKGDIAENQSGGVGQTSYWHYAQGDFCFIETYTCITHSYPWVNQTVYGSGGYTGSAGGN